MPGATAGAGMYGGADRLLGAGVGASIQRPLSAGGYAAPGMGMGYGASNGAGTGYGPGELGETAIMRHERHRAERAADRAERALLKEARYRDRNRYGGMGRRLSFDDNYEYEYGRGGYGDDYGYGGYGGGYGSGYGGATGYGPRYGRRRGYYGGGW